MSSTPPDIFLSYNREDQATARRFAEAFEHAGFSVWWDVTLRSGEDYDKVTEKALEDAKAVVVLWSKKSVDSSWVRAEATQADRNKTLVPVTIESCKRPIMFELKQTSDLSHWKGDANDKVWQALLSDVQRLVQKQHTGANDQPIAATPRRKPAMKFMLAAELVLIVAVVAVVLWHFTGGTSQPESKTSTASTTATAPANAATGVSLAVLPFADMSPAHDQDYFSDGLSEEILNQLAQNKDLRLTARTSSFSFKGKNEDLRVIGEKLGVANILEGSVRKADKQLRITAQLINTADGTHLWSKTYDRELNDVFAIQEEIAKEVSAALSVTLDVGAMSRAKGGTTNIEAYDLYLQARKFNGLSGRDNLLKAGSLYRDAVAVDPAFVIAWRELYETLANVLIYASEHTAEARQEMTAISARLESLAPDAWQTHAARAVQWSDQHEWLNAETEAKTALATMPRSQTGIPRFYTNLLFAVGRPNEAIPYLQRAKEADPLSLAVSYSLQVGLIVSNRMTELQAEYDRSQTLEGDHVLTRYSSIILISHGKEPHATAAITRLRANLENGSPLEQALAKLLDNPQASLVLLGQQSSPTSGVDLQQITQTADYFGDKALVLATLHRRFVELQQTNSGNIWIPYLTSIRSDPRFKQLLRDLKLVDYYRASGNWGEFCKPLGNDDFECH